MPNPAASSSPIRPLSPPYSKFLIGIPNIRTRPIPFKTKDRNFSNRYKFRGPENRPLSPFPNSIFYVARACPEERRVRLLDPRLFRLYPALRPFPARFRARLLSQAPKDQAGWLSRATRNSMKARGLGFEDFNLLSASASAASPASSSLLETR